MEDWKVISDFPNYSVSNFGNVRNDVKNTLMTHHLKRGGYYQVRLSRNCLTKDFYIHHLVIKYFGDEKPNDLNIKLEKCNITDLSRLILSYLYSPFFTK
jgi:hypothetical protein